MRLLRNRPPLIDRFSGFSTQVASCLDPGGYDIAIVEHIWCASYVQQLRPYSGLTVLDVHNIESTWHERLATTESSLRGMVLRRFASACRKFEHKWLPQYDALLVTSEADSKLLSGTSKIIYPNALPLVPRPLKRRDDAIIFTGNLEYQPNLTAIAYFKERIWPLLRSRFPGLIWRIAGKNSDAVASIVNDDSRIQLTGPMDDSIATIAGAQVAAVPLLAGSGTRFKILEAWAAGTPVVSTSIGAEGLSYTEGEHLLIADEPEKFAQAIAFLLDEPAARAQLAEKGRRLYESRYTWDVAWKMLTRDLSPLLSGTVSTE
ncbi:MAG TPA: glycosyltransferase family 4 protein [Bryobacteraceae bacterium]|nr:glycosyltransferase family 4 protein [Bryobacteraceae bacterium]